MPRLLIIERHAWSGCVRITDGSKQVVLDAYHRIQHRHAVDVSDPGPSLSIGIVGRNPVAKGSECVIVGAVV